MPKRSLRVYGVLFRQAWAETFVVPEKIVVSVTVLSFRIGILLMIYRAAYQFSGTKPNDIPFTSAIWSIGFYFVMLSSMIRQTYLDISNDIRHGTVELRLNKPYYYPFAMIVTRLGRGLPTMLLSLIVNVPLLYMLAGPPDIVFSLTWLIQVSLLFVAGIAVASLFYAVIGMTAFWLEDATPVYWISDKLVMVFGGAYVPVLLFPTWLKTLNLWLPFGGFTSLAQAFHYSFHERWFLLLGSQLAWIGILLAVVWYLFRRASRVVSINGG